MKYTTIERIRLNLGTRLNIVESTVAPMLGQTKAGSITVDPERVELIANRIEARIEAIWSQIYELPVPIGHCFDLIQSIVEKYICAELMNMHFEGTQMASVGGDAGYGSLMYQQANNEIKQLVLGHGIFIPGVMSAEESNYMKEAQPISLVPFGAINKINKPDTVTKNRTVISILNNKITNNDPFEFIGNTYE